jgi:hypothetical protein
MPSAAWSRMCRRSSTATRPGTVIVRTFTAVGVVSRLSPPTHCICLSTVTSAAQMHGRRGRIRKVSPVFANSEWNTTTSARTFGWQSAVADADGRPLFADDPGEMAMQLFVDLYDDIHSAWTPADLEDASAVIWLRK